MSLLADDFKGAPLDKVNTTQTTKEYSGTSLPINVAIAVASLVGIAGIFWAIRKKMKWWFYLLLLVIIVPLSGRGALALASMFKKPS